MPSEPTTKRAVAFIDGQNLYHAAREAFGYGYPNYDVRALATAVCQAQGWAVQGVRFYTGVPEQIDNAFWYHFWTAKRSAMGHQGVHVFSRPLRYRQKTVQLPDGSKHSFIVGQEKGIDVRIALDIIRTVHQKECDVALVFSQDQDLSEVAKELRLIGCEQNRWIKMACAFPVSPTTRNRRGIHGTDWIKIDRATYDACIDPKSYRPKPTRP